MIPPKNTLENEARAFLKSSNLAGTKYSRRVSKTI